MRYRLGSFEADADAFELRRAGVLVPIEPKPLRLLLDLLSHAPALRSLPELREALWAGENVTMGSLPRAVNALRRALGPGADGWIETVRGRGYRIVVPVEAIESSSDPHVDWRELFVGRSEILAALEGRLVAAEAGEGSITLLAGEPGIGKTRTAEILTERARGRGARVHWGRCAQARGGPPYLPWLEILRSELRDHGARDSFLDERRRVAQFLAILMPELHDRLPFIGEPPQLSSDQARHGLFDGVTELLRHASRQRPLTLVLDDLHWADEPSLRLLAFLARRIGSLRVLVLGTVRSHALGPRPAFEAVLAELVALPRVGPELRLGGLSAGEVGALVQAALGADASAELVASVHARTGGNPFFVRELTRALALRGGAAGAPPAVRMTVALRVNELPARERRILEVSAVLGREASIGLVARVAGLPPAAVFDAVPGLVQQGLLEEAPAGGTVLRFQHDIVREAVYDAMCPSERMATHAAVAETLEGLGLRAAPAELAHHFAEAAPLLGVQRALAHLRRAGREALERLAGEQAARFFERALAVLELEPGAWRRERCELVLGLAEAREAVGAQAQARLGFAEAARLARDLEAPESFARAVLGITRHVPGHVTMGAFEPQAVALLEEALARLDTADESLRLELLGTLVPKLYWAGRSGAERAEQLGRQAVEEARASGSSALRALCLCRRHLTLWHAEGLEERLALAQEAIALTDPARDPRLHLEACFLRIVDLFEFGEFARAFADVNEYRRVAREIRHRHLEAQAEIWGVARALAEGRLDDAGRGLASAEALIADGRAPSYAVTLGYQRLLFDWLRGELETLDPRFDELARATPLVPSAAALVAWLAAELGEETRARVQLAAVAACAPELGRTLDSLFVGAAGALTCQALGHEALAARLYDGLIPYAGRYVSAGLGIYLLGSVSRYLGILAAQLGRHEEAERHFEEARAANWRAGQRLWLAETLCDHALLLRRRDAPGDRTAARRLADEAADLAAQLALPAAARRVERVQRELGSVVSLRRDRPAPRRR